jgi:hypothetical protein
VLGDIVLSFYIGASQTRPSDLHVVQAARQNDATIRSVTWHGYPFRFEIYYGIRLTYTPQFHPWTRLALDYTHYKVYAETDDVLVQDGTWHGTAFRETAPMRERVQSIEMTHGLNMLSLNVLQQIGGPGGTGAYAGGGPVIFLPHTESRIDGIPHTSGYDFGGSGFQIVAGASGCADSHRLFAEMKYSNGAPFVAIAQGRAQTALHTVHELAGVQFGHCANR